MVNDLLARTLEEQKELGDKIYGIDIFLRRAYIGEIEDIPGGNKMISAMEMQSHAMQLYYQILQQRIDLIKEAINKAVENNN